MTGLEPRATPTRKRTRSLGYRIVLGVQALIAAAAVWSACAVDDRNPDTEGVGGSQGIGNLQGGSGGADGQLGPAVASINVDPDSLNLGAVVVGSPARARLHISNTGDSPTGAPNVVLANGGPVFSLLQNECDASLLPGGTLGAGKSCEVRLLALAPSPGNFSGQLTIDAGGTSTSVSLGAVGSAAANELILAPAPGSSDNLGAVRIGTSVESVFNLTNSGVGSTGPLAIHIYNGDVTLGTSAPGSCNSGTSLGAGQTCDVHLAFAPTHRGAADAMLVVSADAGSVALGLSARGIAPGTLGVSQLSLDFDGVVLGDSGDRLLRVTNQGDEALVLGGAAIAGPQQDEFSIETSDCSSGRTLAAGASCDVLTGFKPATSGDAKSAVLTITTSAGGSQAVNLIGAGLDQGTLTVAPLAGNLTDFGAIALGSSQTQVFQVVNSSAQTSGPLTFTASGDFTLVPSSDPSACQSSTTSLDTAGASCQLTVQLAPTRRAAQYGSISVRSPLAKSASLHLTGTGMAPPSISIAQDEINFGHVLTGGTYQTAVTVLNQGDQPLDPPTANLLDPSGATPASGFSLSNGCTSALGFQESCTLNVSFQPTQVGYPAALLRLDTTSGGSASALLYATVSQAGTLVLATADGSSADFGDVGVGASVARSFTLTNPSSTPSGRLSVTASSPLFVIDAGTCNAQAQGLANGDSCAISVTYTPITAEAANATLSILSPGAGGAALPLTGQGRSLPNLVAVGNRDFGSANVGQKTPTVATNDFTWTLTNDGDLPTGSLQLSNSNTTDFTVNPDACSGQPLAGHGTCSVTIQFRPTGSIGARSANLVVTDTTSSKTVTLQMTGSGIQIAQPGQSCLNGATCSSGVCTGGVCCDRACINSCQKCDATGVCQDQDNQESCGGNGSGAVCFGVGVCRLPQGQPCTQASQCGSGNCELVLGGNLNRVCCAESCASGDQCNSDGSGCQQPTLQQGDSCGPNTPACGANLSCKACPQGGSECTPTNKCCGTCPGAQVCNVVNGNGTCGCPSGTIDCQDGRCIPNVAGACCDSNGCGNTGQKTSCGSQQANLCGCPSNASRDCGSNVCIPSSQCCNCSGPCNTCNSNNGTCSPVPNGSQGGCQAGQFCSNGSCNSCPIGQVLSGGTCKLQDGAACTPGSTPCVSTSGCTSWFIDNDGDGFGTGTALNRCGPNPPSDGRRYARQGGDCCDTSADAHPGQTATFTSPLPAECQCAGAANGANCSGNATCNGVSCMSFDYNCNKRNEGPPTRANCDQTTCCTNESTNSCPTTLFIPQIQVDPVPGGLPCGQSVVAETCSVFTDPNTGILGCNHSLAPEIFGIPCN
jgi:hypothetical protein